MKERPILFSAPMVLALLADQKHQTRRVIKPQPNGEYLGESALVNWAGSLAQYAHPSPSHEEVVAKARQLKGRIFPFRNDNGVFSPSCPYVPIGSKLWVRETWASGYQNGCWGTIYRADSTFVQGKRQHEKGPHFHAKQIGPHIRWRPSIFMPRWASRITLEITDIKVERVQDISHEDALDEGCKGYNWVSSSPYIAGPHTDDGQLPQEEFAQLWDSINGKKHPWKSNPWVFAITFKRLENNNVL